MQLFDWLFYQFFLLGRWGKYRTNGRVVLLACRFYGYLLTVNCVFLLLPAFRMLGDAPVVRWFFVVTALVPIATVTYFYGYRKRCLKAVRRYHDPTVKRGNWNMTGRLLLTMSLSLCEVVLVCLLAIVST